MNSHVVHKDLQNDDYIAWAKFLREADGWDIEKIRDFELSEIGRIIKHAYKNTKGYQKLFESVRA